MAVDILVTTGFDGPAARRHQVSVDGRNGPFLLMLHGFGSARAIFYSDFRKRMPLVTAKTSVLQMPDDIVVPTEVGDFLNRKIGSSVLEAIDADGHFPHLSKPTVVLDAFRRHLKR